MIHLLLSKGVDPNQPDWEGKTPLIWAVEYSSELSIKALMDAGALPNKPATYSGETPLIAASSLGNLEAAKILLAGGANVNAAEVSGITAIHEAKSAEMAKLLISAGANLKSVTAGGETPADAARRLENLEALAVITNHINVPVFDFPK
jgi:ankyrin repeat protein